MARDASAPDEPRHVSHLAARPRLGLAVEMQLVAGVAENLQPVGRLVAQQVLHHRIAEPLGRAQRQACDGAGELLELRGDAGIDRPVRSEEHTSELQSLMRISYAVFCLKKKNHN